LKKKLSDQKGDWVEYLLEVLWAYRTTKRAPTKETPYALAFKPRWISLLKWAQEVIEQRLSSLRPMIKVSIFIWTYYRRNKIKPDNLVSLPREGGSVFQ
jgi:hypothetical protein